jgi:ADP-heptose:LPS heptosyltransferase
MTATRVDILGDPLPRRVVVLRALQLGDLLCAVPALRALRSALPEAVISLVGLPWAQSFVRRFRQYLDEFIEFPGFPGLPERQPEIHRLPAFLVAMQQRGFDLGLQMQGSGAITNPLIELLGARQNAGFFLSGQYCPDELRFLPYPLHLPEVRRHLALVEHLGLPSQGEEIEFPLFPADWEDFHRLRADIPVDPGRIACVHPGARALERRWPADWFAAVSDGLSERGFFVVLTGVEDERELAATVAAKMRFPALNLAGKTSLGGFAALLSRSGLLVCNDTGASHLAAALHVPSVVLFTASEPNRWAPLDRKLHRIVPWASTAAPEIVLSEVDLLLNMEVMHAV